MKKKVEAQGINVTIISFIRRDKNATYYAVKIIWSELKRYLCNSELREQLIKAAMRAIENCHIWNMTHHDRKKDCSKIRAAKWLQRLTDPQWLREHIGCPDS